MRPTSAADGGAGPAGTSPSAASRCPCDRLEGGDGCAVPRDGLGGVGIVEPPRASTVRRADVARHSGGRVTALDDSLGKDLARVLRRQLEHWTAAVAGSRTLCVVG